MANLRFQKTFVFDPATQLITTNTLRSQNLTNGQVGIFAPSGLGTGATPTPTTTKYIKIHQNVGDNKFGTVRTQPIQADKVIRYYAKKAVAPVAQVVTIGYNGTEGSLPALTEGQQLKVSINIFSNKIRRYYGNVGYRRTITIAANCGPKTAEEVADELVAQINNTNPNPGDFPTNFELTNFFTAEVIDDAATSFGVQLTAILPTDPTFVGYDPTAPHDVEIPTIAIAGQYGAVQDIDDIYYTNLCDALLVTETVAPVSGNGFASEVRALEAESQGFDRLHTVGHMWDQRAQKPGYIFKAVDGVKYDFYYIQFEYTHQATQNGASPNTITEPYEVIFAVPTGTGVLLEGVLNSYLAPMGFTAIDIADGSSVEGDLEEAENA